MVEKRPESPPEANKSSIDERLEALFSGDLDSLEGEAEAVSLWQTLQSDRFARRRYDAMMAGLRVFSSPQNRFSEGEADVLWPVLMGHVVADARRRSGLSKQALQHLAVPQIVASITRALSDFSRSDQNTIEDTVTATDVPQSADQKDMNFQLTRVGGEVGFRLYRNDELDMRCAVDGDEVRSNVTPADWDNVAAALGELSRATQSLLGEEVLVNGRITIQNGRAEVRLNPLNVVRAANAPSKK